MKPSYCYIGRLPCGCMVASCYDNAAEGKRQRKSTAEFVKQMIEEGLTIERVLLEDVKLETDCPHKDAVQTPRGLLF